MDSELAKLEQKLALLLADYHRLRAENEFAYYDLSAPFYATEFTLAHLNVSPEVRAHNITVGHFESGRMTYVDNKALGKLQGDLASFVRRTRPHRPASKAAQPRSKTMRIHGRLHHSVCLFVILIAATAVGAFAQGGRGRGGAGATNDFYRFNYNAEEAMQPISYPAQPIATQHEITLHGEAIQYTARVGSLPIHNAMDQQLVLGAVAAQPSSRTPPAPRSG